ncbi:FAD-dependent oxidoreductase [Microbacterium sp. NRRL B-14842]|uniref:NAD(P)/FAD-dependent oxidoreductase n=1 Tax=Microbacterium TaxID=33882 RepID=UPI0021A3F24D|nr:MULTISPECIES: FAD-dependent oxidoreductase [Microbacterium]MCT1363779.1 FAD-dependent oxidoreductase [Microbacterium sp. p3-SID131]MCT1375421.1 FAD-dependent oxidoreductase [Microbacterium sp. p3-SID337]MCZ0711475.1 FAD-dependent oxidoreductase [Microbacterium paraoxydans]MDH5135008.1 FAD-dependent oxidoreductase [Microbacterium sp. RD10]MDH5138605.1 FAD-dependent oxidoreductase [Microbacterium sp. RD11]
MPKILIVGGGYAGFYTAWKLEKHLRKGEADVTMVDPLPYMTYQPFLPEVAAGSIEARHSVVAHRRHLKRTHVLTAKVTNINHAQKVATITPPVGEPYEFAYDQIVVTAGAVSRTFPIPGIADNAIGLKTIEEAVAIRDKVMSNFDKAASLPAGPERDRLLTVVVVGGGFAGIEVFAELRSLASSLVSKYPQLSFEDTHFHLIEAMGRIMPEVSLKTSEWVLKDLAKRGANVHLDTQVTGAIDGNVELSTGEVIPTDVIVWTAGVMANPTVVRGGDLPVEERGRIQTRADLRVGTPEAFVEGAWAAGDVSAVPDLSGGGVGGFCVPNAQHAVRQAKLLAKNVVAVLRGESPKEYFHKNLGAVAGLGLYNGVFQSGKIALKGFIAWLAHRGYHGLAMPTWERKWRVLWGWWNNLWLGRDLVNLQTVQNPRYVFEEFAARPRPAAPADTAPASGAPAAKAPAAEKPAAAPAAETPAEIKKPAAKRPAAKKAPASSSKDSAETAAAK